MKLTCRAFEEAKEIPKRHSSEGEDVSPAFQWTEVPESTRAFALICEDPDAPFGTLVHWTIYNLPANSTGLPEDVPKRAELESGARQGKNSLGRVGYMGPCPPNGPFHRYYFTLYALDGPLPLAGKVGARQFRKAVEAHMLASARTMGRYRKVPLRTFVKTLLGR